MKQFALIAAATVVLSSVVGAQGTDVTAQVPIRNVTAFSVASLAESIRGLSSVTIDLKNYSVAVHGEPAAVNAFKTSAAALDIPQQQYELSARVIRCHMSAKGERTETDMMNPKVYTSDGYDATVTLSSLQAGGYSVVMKASHAAANTVTLTAELEQLADKGSIVMAGKDSNVVSLGKITRIVGMVGSPDPAFVRAVVAGKSPVTGSEYTAYYLDVTPTPVAPDGSGK